MVGVAPRHLLGRRLLNRKNAPPEEGLRKSTAIWILPAIVVSACSTPMASRRPEGAASLQAVSPANLCVTLGEVQKVGERQMEVTAPAMRAVVAGSTAPVATLHFLYEGPSAESAPLANGELRRQIGLKLRAQDTCNLVYVMWRIEPQAGLAVSVKHNPGKHLHSECGTEGYRSVSPRRTGTLPILVAGEPHFLQATMHENELKIFVDRQLAWEGDLGEDAASFDGPVGLRTDNGRFAFELEAMGAGGASPAHCDRYAASD
jgi:hypothetical protein